MHFITELFRLSHANCVQCWNRPTQLKKKRLKEPRKAQPRIRLISDSALPHKRVKKGVAVESTMVDTLSQPPKEVKGNRARERETREPTLPVIPPKEDMTTMMQAAANMAPAAGISNTYYATSKSRYRKSDRGYDDIVRTPASRTETVTLLLSN